ncbi:ensconsin isoform f [Anaeramoeba ignava]|uniref:Ensconsin isoform f n=1 Tax=Anaeramoeba ignava TaxID=1746090 RepID=A0A9Q0LJY9_ANAIG|nr:ensconsin isoform f [Anaeramoeba ignava]
MEFVDEKAIDEILTWVAEISQQRVTKQSSINSISQAACKVLNKISNSSISPMIIEDSENIPRIKSLNVFSRNLDILPKYEIRLDADDKNWKETFIPLFLQFGIVARKSQVSPELKLSNEDILKTIEERDKVELAKYIEEKQKQQQNQKKQFQNMQRERQKALKESQTGLNQSKRVTDNELPKKPQQPKVLKDKQKSTLKIEFKIIMCSIEEGNDALLVTASPSGKVSIYVTEKLRGFEQWKKHLIFFLQPVIIRALTMDPTLKVGLFHLSKGTFQFFETTQQMEEIMEEKNFVDHIYALINNKDEDSTTSSSSSSDFDLDGDDLKDMNKITNPDAKPLQDIIVSPVEDEIPCEKIGEALKIKEYASFTIRVKRGEYFQDGVLTIRGKKLDVVSSAKILFKAMVNHVEANTNEDLTSVIITSKKKKHSYEFFPFSRTMSQVIKATINQMAKSKDKKILSFKKAGPTTSVNIRPRKEMHFTMKKKNEKFVEFKPSEKKLKKAEGTIKKRVKDGKISHAVTIISDVEFIPAELDIDPDSIELKFSNQKEQDPLDKVLIQAHEHNMSLFKIQFTNGHLYLISAGSPKEAKIIMYAIQGYRAGVFKLDNEKEKQKQEEEEKARLLLLQQQEEEKAKLLLLQQQQKEREEKEAQERKDREEQERKDREEQERKDREEQERKEKEEQEKARLLLLQQQKEKEDREEQERKEKEEQERKEKKTMKEKEKKKKKKKKKKRKTKSEKEKKRKKEKINLQRHLKPKTGRTKKKKRKELEKEKEK